VQAVSTQNGHNQNGPRPTPTIPSSSLLPRVGEREHALLQSWNCTALLADRRVWRWYKNCSNYSNPCDESHWTLGSTPSSRVLPKFQGHIFHPLVVELSMAQHQPRRTGAYDQPIPPAAAAPTPNQPRTVETYERPARSRSVSGIALAAIVLMVLVILAVLFLRS